MKVKKYGSGEKTLVLVHGGPGGAGSLSCMAKQYAQDGNGKVCVLEPWQSKTTVRGQVGHSPWKEKHAKDILKRILLENIMELSF